MVGGTNGQGYFAAGDIGTGKFTSRGYNAVLSPGGAHESDTVIEGDTDSNGLFIARYRAQDHGAEEKITFEVKRPATASDPEVKGVSREEPLLIAIPGLVRITHDNGLLAFRDGGGCVSDAGNPHNPLPHWLTPNTRSRVIALAAIYHLQTERLLSLNDGSLPLGGVIARRRGNEDADHCHDSHRQGVDIDFNSHDRQVGQPGQEPVGENMRSTMSEFREEQWTLLEYLDYLANKLGGIDYHGTSSIHYRFPD